MSEPAAPTSPPRLLLPEAAAAAERLAACKAFLGAETARIRAAHEAGASGRAIARARSVMIDELLQHLFERACRDYSPAVGEPPPPVVLTALGGYGREELCPSSDIDVMFLFPAKTKAAAIQAMQECLTRDILYVLWDCDLKVGHSTRTVDEVFAEARGDIQTKTALLESRRIAGSTALYATFAQAYRSYYTTENPRAYIAARLTDQAERRAKYGDTVFLQEPDVKNGVGGLRDYQNTLWMARVMLDITTMAELVAQAYIRERDIQTLERAYDFLLRVRNELHFLAPHPTDVLDLEIQPKIAWNLGYRQPEVLARVERFMQDYYRSAQTIHRMSKLVEDRLALGLEQDGGGRSSWRNLLPNPLAPRAKRLDGFIVRGRELAAESPDVFRADPSRLIRVFRHCQQLDCRPDFHLAGAIRDSLDLITPAVVASKDANVSFKAVLQAPGAVHPILGLMHELGVLGRFIPEFDKLTCLVQHEFYHRYTADVHTLNAIRELDGVFAQTEPLVVKYRQALHETAEPTLLYLALLLHDLGKAVGIKGHAEAGVRIAGPIMERLCIPAESRVLVSFLIKHHLAMTRVWQKQDVDDPATAAAFAATVEEPEKLHYLYVHTFCDARGTAASLWNGYKDTLHTSLYRHTLEYLRLGQAVHARHEERKRLVQQELLARQLPGVTADEVSAHFDLLPNRYFAHADVDEVALHLRMVHQLLKTIATAESLDALRPVIDWHDDINRSLTVVDIVTWDRAGLFAKLAGAFSVAGLTILSARAISRKDHIAIDTFYVAVPGRGLAQDQAVQQAFEAAITSALTSDVDLYPAIVTQARKLASRFLPDPNQGPHTSLARQVNVARDERTQRIIVEIQARDRIGLLYLLASTISRLGFSITFSRIGTERGLAIDTFHIAGTEASGAVDAARLDTLRQALNAIVQSEEAAA